MREKWRIFRERWPSLPLSWKVAIIGLSLVTAFEIIRVAINLVRGVYF
jgi:hypothetical protein